MAGKTQAMWAGVGAGASGLDSRSDSQRNVAAGGWRGRAGSACR